MKKIKKELLIEKSRYPEDDAKYILYYHTETKHGCNWRRIFKGTFKECIAYKRSLLNE